MLGIILLYSFCINSLLLYDFLVFCPTVQKKDGSEGTSRTGKGKGTGGVLPPPPGGLGKIAPPPAAAAPAATLRQSPGASPAHRTSGGAGAGTEWTDYASAG